MSDTENLFESSDLFTFTYMYIPYPSSKKYFNSKTISKKKMIKKIFYNNLYMYMYIDIFSNQLNKVCPQPLPPSQTRADTFH